MKTDAWIIAKPLGPPGLYVRVKPVTFQLLVGSKRYTPCFTSIDEAQEFATTIHQAGYDMSFYEVVYVQGLEDEGDLVWDLDADLILSQAAGDLRIWQK